MLAAALQAEVAAYVEQFVDQVDEHGRRLVVRNGYHHERDVLTAAGAVAVRAPRVNDRRVDPDTGERLRFSSAILPAYGMAETTLAVSFSECNAGLVVDEVDADLLAALRRAVPATKGNTRRLATLGPLLKDLEARIIDEQGNVMDPRGVGVIELRGESLTPGYLTMGGFISAQDEHGWYDTGDLGYINEDGHIVVCGRVKDVIIMAGRNIYPTDIERAAGRVEGVRIGCAVAVRLDAGHSRETFAVAVESNAWQDPVEVRRIEHQVAHEVVTEVDVRPRNVVVLGPGTIPKTSSGKLRRANSVTLVT